MFYVSRDGRQYGPYTAEAIRGYLADGSLLATDQVCAEGETVWRPLGSAFAPVAVAMDGAAGSARAASVPPVVDAAPKPPLPPPTSPPVQTWRRWAVPLAGALVVCGSLAAIYLLFFRPPEPVLLMEGSTTIGDALAPALLKSFLSGEGATEVREVIKADSTGTRREIQAKLPGSWQPRTFAIVANGSGNAFKALAGHRAEIGMASRPVNDQEWLTLSKDADLRSPANESIVALDGLAVVANNANPLNNLTRQQTAAIFSGRITDWTQAGGQPGPIHLYGRAADSGTFDTFAALVFGGNKKAFSSSLRTLGDGEAIARAVASDPMGVGYVGLAQIGSAKALALSDGTGTTPLLPSPFTVATEDYILSRRLFFYALTGRSDFAARFIAYALSPEGQTVVEEIGFVKQTPALEEQAAPSTAPAAYRRQVAGLRRMSLNFRFQANSVKLDNKALADLPRAVRVLMQNGRRDAVCVLGFADNRGMQNQKLSEDRARAVAERLGEYGIQVQPVGFSSAMPVADNATLEGREKNRRVEIWAR